MKPLDLPVRQRDCKNIHVCETCRGEYYRRTGKNPNRKTRFCCNDCRWSFPKSASPVPSPEAPAIATRPPIGLVAASVAGQIVGYSESQVRRLASAGKIERVKDGKRVWVSIPSLREYIAAAA